MESITIQNQSIKFSKPPVIPNPAKPDRTAIAIILDWNGNSRHQAVQVSSEEGWHGSAIESIITMMIERLKTDRHVKAFQITVHQLDHDGNLGEPGGIRTNIFYRDTPPENMFHQPKWLINEDVTREEFIQYINELQ